MRAITGALAAFLFIPSITCAIPSTQDDAIFHVEAGDCEVPPIRRAQTGFSLRNFPGIITALHGVAGCRSLSARQWGTAGVTVTGLKVTSIDLARDVALLRLADESAPLPALDAIPLGSRLPRSAQVIGYPANMPGLLKMHVEIPATALRRLEELVPPEIHILLSRRGSPQLGITVVSIVGNIQPGHSGGPILDDQGRVIAISSGGLAGGTLGIGWAIPITDLSLTEPGVTDLQTVSHKSPASLFAYDATTSDDDTVKKQTKLILAHMACQKADRAEARILFMELDRLFPQDPAVADRREACDQLFNSKRKVTIALDASSIVVRGKPKRSFFGEASVEVDDRYCALLDASDTAAAISCNVNNGDLTYSLTGINVTDEDRRFIARGGSCGGRFRVFPASDWYIIFLCVDPKKKLLHCAILAKEDKKHAPCPFD
jgi:hypothetical protein